MSFDGMRRVTISREEATTLGPEGVAEKLKAAGFVFLREGCPWVLRHPFRYQGPAADGAHVFEQWNEGAMQ